MKVGPGPIPSDPQPLDASQATQAAGAAAQAGAPAAPAEAAAPDASVVRGAPPAPSSSLEQLAGTLLRQVLDHAMPLPGAEKPSIKQQLELVFSGMRLLAEIEKNPQAAKDFLKNASFDQKALLSGLKDFATELRRAPGEAIIGGLGTLKDALDGTKLEEVEARLQNLGTVSRQGSVSGGREASGSKSGKVEGKLGSAEGTVAGRAGVSGSARGDVEAGLGRATARGEASGTAGAEGSARGKVTTGLGSVEGGVKGKAGAKGDAAGAASVGVSGAQAQGTGRASVGVGGEIDGHVKSALAKANARLRGDAEAYVEADGTAHANLKDGLRAKGKAEIGVRAKVQVDGDFRTGGVRIGGERVDLNGEIHAQAEVSARASVEADVAATLAPPRALLEAKGDAFAGVKAGVEGKIGVGDFVTLSGHAEAWAGAGAEAGITAGYDDGKLRFGFNLGAAVGVGYGVGFGIEIDVASIANAAIGGAIDLAEGAIDFALNPIDGLKNIAEDIGSIFVGPDAPPIDYGLYPQLATLFPPMIFEEGVSKADADQASQQLEETVKRVARDNRIKAEQEMVAAQADARKSAEAAKKAKNG